MRIMWIGFKITEKQFKELKKRNYQVNPKGFTCLEYLGRKVKFEDLVSGTITKIEKKDEKYMVVKY